MITLSSEGDHRSTDQNLESAERFLACDNQAELTLGNLDDDSTWDDCDVHRLDRFIARADESGLSTLCVLLLHVIEPFETIASQMLLLLVPFISSAEPLADIIQDRKKMDYLRTRFETFSTDHSEEE